MSALLTLLAIGCRGDTGDADETPAPAPDASQVTILTGDGLRLDARLFAADPDRIVILLHMYQANQQSWFETARLLRDRGISALTVDFRGYGASEGEVDPAELDEDVRAAIEFVRSRGYERVVLVGASMGGTAAIVTAAAEGQLDGVVTLSAPGRFRGLDAEEAVEQMEAPLAMIAARGDTSAEHTVSTFEEQTHVHPEWSLILEGKAHGTELLESASGDEVTRMLFAFLEEVWASEG
jgi:pimeloyl-ACP methyl ester carboxylesterase